MKKPAIAYDFHVAIIGAIDIWRRIRLVADRKLWDLNKAIYQAYDPVDDHMFCFYLTKLAQIFTAMPPGSDTIIQEKHGESPDEFKVWPPGRL